MAQGILLDSSVVIPHLRGRLDLGAQSINEPFFIPLIVVGELYKGVFKSSQTEKTRIVLENFLLTVAVLNPDMATAVHYAQISAKLERKGTPIPENDVWIAAMAMESSMPLATRDIHFAHIEGLQLLSW